jgi:hypothetical protein
MAESGQRPPRWRVGIDLVLAGAIVYVASLVATSAIEAANRRAELRLVKAEAAVLFRAFETYAESNHGYPNAYVEPRFDPATLDPLRRRGYYRGALLTALDGHRADAYGSPDDGGPNREFWLELSLASDPAIRVLLARSDDAPLGGGKRLDGVYVLRDGALEPL